MFLRTRAVRKQAKLRSYRFLKHAGLDEALRLIAPCLRSVNEVHLGLAIFSPV